MLFMAPKVFWEWKHMYVTLPTRWVRFSNQYSWFHVGAKMPCSTKNRPKCLYLALSGSEGQNFAPSQKLLYAMYDQDI